MTKKWNYPLIQLRDNSERTTPRIRSFPHDRLITKTKYVNNIFMQKYIMI